MMPTLFHGAVLDWSGFSDGNWSTSSNWSPAGPPEDDDSLTFSGLISTATINDLTVDTEVDTVALTNVVDGENFSLSGNRIALVGEVVTSAVADPSNDAIEDLIDLDILIVNSGIEINTGAGHGVRVNGVISGSGELVVNDGPNSSDDGLVRLAGVNTHSGGTRLLGGSLSVLNDAALGSGELAFEDRSNSNPSLILGQSGLLIANDLLFRNRGAAKSVILDVDGSSVSTLSGDITLNETGNRNVRFQVGENDVLTLSGLISGVGRLTVRQGEGGGVLRLSNANTYSGGTAIEQATLRVENDNGLGSGEVFIEDRGVNPVLEFAGGLTVANDISILNRGSNKRIRLNESGAVETTINGDITIAETSEGRFDIEVGSNDRLILNGLISGTTNAGMDKVGSGTLVLQNSANTYVGRSRVSSGLLLINGNNNAAVGDLLLTSNGSLGGSGSTGGAISSEGAIEPGDEGIAAFTAGSADMMDGSSYSYEVDSSAVAAMSADLLVLNSGVSVAVTGDLSLSGTVELVIVDIAAAPMSFAIGTVVNLINYNGAWNGGAFTYSGTIVQGGDRFIAGLNEWEINYGVSENGQNQISELLPDGSSVTLTAVPEAKNFGISLLMLTLIITPMIRRRWVEFI